MEYTGKEGFSSTYLPDPTKLLWHTTNETINILETASQKSIEACKGYNANAITFEGYGTKYMKQVAKTNPDTYFQLVLQLAWMKLHGIEDLKPVYESASTRRFLGGRTETIRSLTSESIALSTIYGSKEILVTLFLIYI